MYVCVYAYTPPLESVLELAISFFPQICRYNVGFQVYVSEVAY